MPPTSRTLRKRWWATVKAQYMAIEPKVGGAERLRQLERAIRKHRQQAKGAA